MTVLPSVLGASPHHAALDCQTTAEKRSQHREGEARDYAETPESDDRPLGRALMYDEHSAEQIGEYQC